MEVSTVRTNDALENNTMAFPKHARTTSISYYHITAYKTIDGEVQLDHLKGPRQKN